MNEKHIYWNRVGQMMNSGLNMDNFKNWDLVRKIPIYNYGIVDSQVVSIVDPFEEEVIQMLQKKSPEEQKRWASLLKEPFRGHSSKSYLDASVLLFGLDPSPVWASQWAVKSAHHLLFFEEVSGLLLKSYDQIVEIGAGIGETARILLDSGFQKPYRVLDLPEIYRISSYYLSDYPNVSFHNQFQTIPREGKTLVIGTWSFSEMPIPERDLLVEYFHGADFHFIWQDLFYEYDNQMYFQRTLPEKNPDYQWIDRKIIKLQHDWYLTGLSNANR